MKIDYQEKGALKKEALGKEQVMPWLMCYRFYAVPKSDPQFLFQQSHDHMNICNEQLAVQLLLASINPQNGLVLNGQECICLIGEKEQDYLEICADRYNQFGGYEQRALAPLIQDT